MNEKLDITIEYCVPWNYLLRAAWTAEEILLNYADRVSKLTLIPGGGGRFEVTINGDLVYSKAETKVFPELKQVIEAVAARLS